MGFFKDLLTDFKNYNTPIGVLQGKVIDYTNFLQAVTHGQLNLSEKLAIEKAKVLAKEIEELSEMILNKSQTFKIYHPKSSQNDIVAIIGDAPIICNELLDIYLTKKQRINWNTLMVIFGTVRNNFNK